MNHLLSDIAYVVAQSISRRRWDQHRVLNEELVNHLFCHQLLTSHPDFKSRIWIGYRPWPTESTESIGYWIDADGEQTSFGLEVRVDDPQEETTCESKSVWGKILADVLRLATAITHCQLGSGYVLLFGELRRDAEDQRNHQFPFSKVGETRSIATSSLSSNAVMDEGFFEEILHPHELVPAQIELQLVAAEETLGFSYWIWRIGLPAED